MKIWRKQKTTCLEIQCNRKKKQEVSLSLLLERHSARLLLAKTEKKIFFEIIHNCQTCKKYETL